MNLHFVLTNNLNVRAKLSVAGSPDQWIYPGASGMADYDGGDKPIEMKFSNGAEGPLGTVTCIVTNSGPTPVTGTHSDDKNKTTQTETIASGASYTISATADGSPFSVAWKFAA